MQLHITYLDQFLLGRGGGGVQQKKIMFRENPKMSFAFLFFFVLFQSTFKMNVLVPNLVKSVFQKRTEKIMVFAFFDLFCSVNFFVALVNKMYSNREQKKQKDHATGKIAWFP